MSTSGRYSSVTSASTICSAGNRACRGLPPAARLPVRALLRPQATARAVPGAGGGCREGFGSSVRPGPPHTSPTVVLTGSTQKCGVGSSAERITKGNSGGDITPTYSLSCMVVPEEDGTGAGVQSDTDTGDCEVEQEQGWHVHRSSGGREGIGSSVKPGPPHTSPTVVLTGFTWKCGVGPSSSGNYKGNKVANSSPTDTLPCMMDVEEEGPGTGNCGAEKEHPWLLHRLPEKERRWWRSRRGPAPWTGCPLAECPSIGLSCYWVWPVATDCGQAMAPAEIDHMNGRMSATRPAGRARGSGCRLCSRWPLLRPHDYVFGQARSSRPVT